MIDSGFPPETPPFVPPPKNEVAFSVKKVLIAEDSVTAARKLMDFFDSLHISNELYSDGAALIERLDTIDTSEVGLVVTDLEMPRRDGFQVIAHIKQTGRLSALHVVVNSSMTSSGILEKIRGFGEVELVNKSDTHALFELVKKYMQMEV